MTNPNLRLPPGIWENEPFDGKLLYQYSEEFQCGRNYLLGSVIENSGGIRSLVIFPVEPSKQVSFEDTHYYCTFVSRNFTHLPVGVSYLLEEPPLNWVTERLKKDARKANSKLLKNRYKYLESLQNRESEKMSNHFPLIFRELETYLSEREIPFRAYERFGIIRFSAVLDCSPKVYYFQVNVFDCGFRVDVSVPVKLPRPEKTVVRLHKFCAKSNLLDPNGCFLALNPEAEKLLCRHRITCYGEIPWAVERELPMAARKMACCLPLVETLIQGKTSVEEAMKTLNRNSNMSDQTFLTAPQTRIEHSRYHASREQPLNLHLDDFIRKLEARKKLDF